MPQSNMHQDYEDFFVNERILGYVAFHISSSIHGLYSDHMSDKHEIKAEITGVLS